MRFKIIMTLLYKGPSKITNPQVDCTVFLELLEMILLRMVIKLM